MRDVSVWVLLEDECVCVCVCVWRVRVRMLKRSLYVCLLRVKGLKVCMEGGPYHYVWVCMDGEYVCMLGDVGRRVHLYGHTPHTVTQPLLAHTDLGSGGKLM